MMWMNSNNTRRIRRIYLLPVLMCLGSGLQAQTLAEWTKQKKLQTSYKVNQIAALSAYLEVAKKGYEVARVGWRMVGDIQDGEFSLHSDYFGSLSSIHPMVRDYPVAMEIQKMYRQINREVAWMNSFLDNQMLLDGEEVLVCGRFNRKIQSQSDLVMDELSGLTSPNVHEMEDGERLAAIDGIYMGIQELFQAIKAYNGRIRLLEVHRKRIEMQQQQVNGFHDVR